MPKINVYLPDDLADAVRESGVPVSAICQRALEQSVRRVTAIRATVLADLAPDDLAAQLPNFTDRARQVVRLAIDSAGGEEVGTRDLLHGLVAEGSNLALHVLRALEIDPAQIAVALGAGGSGAGTPSRFGSTAANAVELTVTEAVAMGHNYVGCEHLLLGLLAEPDGTGGSVLRRFGLDLRSARRAVGAALAGYVHLRSQKAEAVPAPVIAAALKPLVERIERLERRIAEH